VTRSGQPRNAGGDKVTVQIKDPEGGDIHAAVVDHGTGIYSVNFSGEPGTEYSILAEINGVPAKDCPFVFKIPEFSKRVSVNETFKKLTSFLK
jgi:hypothetical protein